MENLETKLEDFKKRLTMLKKDVGIFLNDRRIYASLHIPEFALQGFDGNFYAFNSCTIAVPLIVRDGKVIDWENPVVWEDYSHPMLIHLNTPRQPISLSVLACEKFKGKLAEECRKADAGKTLIEHQVYEILLSSMQTLQSAYSGNRDRASIAACYHLDTETFREEHQRYLSNPTFYRKRVTNRIVS